MRLPLEEVGRLRADVEQRQVKYLNNGIVSDPAPIKKLVVATAVSKYESEPGQPSRDSNHYEC